MRKRMVLLVVFVLILALGGCGNSDKGESAADGSGTKAEHSQSDTQQSKGTVKELPALSQAEYKAALEGLVSDKNKTYATYTIVVRPSKEKDKYVPLLQIESDRFNDEERCRMEFESFFGKIVDNNYQYYAPSIEFEFLANAKVTYRVTADGSDQLDAGSSFDRFKLEKQ